jgi:hypothetical protein
MGCDPTTVDIHGANARDLAVRRGHHELAERLNKVLLDKEESEYVYDIYCLDVKRTGKKNKVVEGNPDGLLDNTTTATGGRSVTLLEPLRLSRHELMALRRGTTMGEMEGDQSSDSEDLVYGDDSDSSDGDEEDEDSNDEGDYRNDYPDDEEDGDWTPGREGGGDGDDDEGGGGCFRGSQSSDEDTTYRMPLPGGADDFGDIWKPQQTRLPKSSNYGDYASDESD